MRYTKCNALNEFAGKIRFTELLVNPVTEMPFIAIKNSKQAPVNGVKTRCFPVFGHALSLFSCRRNVSTLGDICGYFLGTSIGKSWFSGIYERRAWK